MSFTHTLLLLLAVSAVAIADVFLKQTQSLGSMSKALMSPWMIGAIALYLFQIVFFTYLFIGGENLIYIGLMQIVLYGIIVLVAGVTIFGESLTVIQTIGALFAILGVVLLNVKLS